MPSDPSAPTLTDGVVTLRAHRPGDAEGVWEQCQDPLSQQWTTVPVPYPVELAVEFVERQVAAGWADHSEWAFALEVDGAFGGTLSLRNEGHRRAEIAYGSHPAVRGTGAVERGLRLLITWGFQNQDLRTISWWADRGNWAARRTAWRLGFATEGTVRQWLHHRGELRDAWVGALRSNDPRRPQTTWLDCPVLEGEGVRLRPLHEADVPRLIEGLGDADTQYWLAFVPRDPDRADARDVLATAQERLASGHTVTWAVGAEDDDRLLGVVGLYRLPQEPELGYWTHPEARGRGLAARAAALAVGHAFDGLELHRLAAYASSPNVRSTGVLDTLGFQSTGVRRQAARTGAGERVDLAGYDLLATEWRSRRAATTRTTKPASESSTPTSSGER